MVNWAVLINLILTVILILLGSLLLWAIVRYFFKLKEPAYKTALLVAAIVGASSLVLSLIGLYTNQEVLAIISLVVEIVLGLFLILVFYRLEMRKAVSIWLVWFILNTFISFVLSFIISFIVTPFIASNFLTAWVVSSLI